MVRSVCLGIGVIVFGILSRDGIGEISFWINIKSGLLVLAGTLIGGLLAVPVENFREFLRHLFAGLKPNETSMNKLIEQIGELARIHRVASIRELSALAQTVEEPYLQRGLQLVIDHQDRRKVEDKMVTEMSFSLSRMQSHLASLNNFTRLAPVFGFVGTIIGLINVLNHMSDAAQIGNGVAISLLTTFYGLLLAHLFFGPLSNKLAGHIQHEKLKFNIIVEGVLGICESRPSLEVVETLSVYMVSTTGPTTATPVKSSLLGNLWGWVWKPRRLAR